MRSLFGPARPASRSFGNVFFFSSLSSLFQREQAKTDVAAVYKTAPGEEKFRLNTDVPTTAGTRIQKPLCARGGRAQCTVFLGNVWFYVVRVASVERTDTEGEGEGEGEREKDLRKESLEFCIEDERGSPLVSAFIRLDERS